MATAAEPSVETKPKKPSTSHLKIVPETREVRDKAGAVQTPADYGELGWLLVTVAVLTVALPLFAIAAVQASRLRTRQ